MQFKDLKGQESAISFLETSLNKGRLSHAYIFCGPRGVGKFLAAMNFAKAIVCTESEKHPDIFVLKPEKELGNIKIDDIRQLIKDIYLKPFGDKKKVYIIDEAQAMKHEAANALLKTLEEPPTDSILILVTEDLKALFHTIVSRSQVVRFYPLKPDEIKDILIKEHSLDDTKAHVLSRLASGRLGKAIEYKDEDIFQKRNALIESVSRRSTAGLSLEETPKEKLKLYLDILLVWFRDILSAKAGADASMFVNADKTDSILNEARRLSFEHLEDVIRNILLTLSYLDQNANTKLAMSVLSLKICEG